MHRHLLTVSPETCIKAAIALMSQAQSSCVLIVEGSSLTGIFTERDLVRLIASGTLTEEATVDGVMTREPIALRVDCYGNEQLQKGFNPRKVRNNRSI